jgi:hypothetical protein
MDQTNQEKHHTKIVIIIKDGTNEPTQVSSQKHFMKFQERQPDTRKSSRISMVWLFYA